jgi:nicotinate-nucleotide pyrophosphorylase (carboxylating)
MTLPDNDPWDNSAVDRLLEVALQEDVGRGDVTSRAVLSVRQQALGRIRAKGALVVAGLPLVPRLYSRLGTVRVQDSIDEGTPVSPGTVLLVARGDARTLLTGERTVLNLLQHLSGIATLTRRCVEALEGSRCVLRDTRKTLPGLRSLEKYAVRVGGGTNHRMRLDDGVLIKDNHVDLAGGVGRAVKAAREALPGHEIEVECRTIEEVDEALDAGADVILLDNMASERLARAVAIIGGRARVEASGGITPERVREIADLGVDYIAMGCLTHSAPAVDLSMDVERSASDSPPVSDGLGGPDGD